LAWYTAIGFAERASALAWPENPTFSLEPEATDAAPVGRVANTQGLYRIALEVDDVYAATTPSPPR
jgi:hypothetical protein